MDQVRIASLQYFIRPIRTFEGFSDQVTALVEAAADYKARLVLFPEYFTVQLLTLGDTRRPLPEQVRALATLVPRFVELMSGLSRRLRIYIAAGTIPAVGDDGEKIHNRCFVFGPTGTQTFQDKLHMTRFESEEWFVSPGSGLRVIQTDFGKLAVTVCYDVEFPELARAAARAGAPLLLVPSCTDDRQGFLRVRYCAHARAIENQMFVVQSGTVGSLPMVPAIHLNYGQAGIMTPSDYGFARDGLLAEGDANQETMIVADLNLDKALLARETGSVLPLRDSQRTAQVMANLEETTL
ncbi:MAG: carbon-nitrogen hydrolase family protein [Candidatus Brocadiae bacterium]|nr:carbon-nitrogen hydrolase family protein [Candidatus Brocadiia bacterium]